MRLIDADPLMDIYANRLKLLVMRYGLDSTACGVLSGAMKLLETQPTINAEDALMEQYMYGQDMGNPEDGSL